MRERSARSSWAHLDATGQRCPVVVGSRGHQDGAPGGLGQRLGRRHLGQRLRLQALHGGRGQLQAGRQLRLRHHWLRLRRRLQEGRCQLLLLLHQRARLLEGRPPQELQLLLLLLLWGLLRVLQAQGRQLRGLLLQGLLLWRRHGERVEEVVQSEGLVIEGHESGHCQGGAGAGRLGGGRPSKAGGRHGLGALHGERDRRRGRAAARVRVTVGVGCRCQPCAMKAGTFLCFHSA